MINYIFWFTQPSIILAQADWILGWGFAGGVALSIILGLIKHWVKAPLTSKILSRFFNLSLTIGLCGLFWVGVRYENTPIFSMRAWAGLVLLIGLIWLIFIVKYLIFNYPKELKEYNHEQLKNKYIPNAKSR
jgi:hypothetical protein